MGTEKKEDHAKPEDGAKGPFPTRSLEDLPEELGTTIGPYRLLSVLGEGGFGIVYRAEHRRPVRRHVALKVLKPGMDSKQVMGRFEAERQALALLDHPNIARVFDGGTTDKGRPYFVMEYVKGVPITEHCDRKKLNSEQRLQLFIQVCDAIQHAHQKGIIHRDIKPSNILVALHGDKDVPKVIDFGVAKAIGQPLTERTLFTEQGQLVGTPEYMSPEQAELTNQDIDTRSDIYSLGILLYELLTGALPFDPKTLHAAAFDEIIRIIREKDPPRPSTRLLNLGSQATPVAASRRTDVRTLAKRLHKELEWIPLKAMRKERERRYKTASELADDVQNYLNGDPLIAGPESVAYRARKFVRKHRTKAAVVVLAGVLFAALAVISVMHIRAVNRSKEAEFLKHINILSKAKELRSKGQFQGALAEAEKILDSEHMGLEARLLHAQLTLELQGPADALKELEKLLGERDDIAGQAHFLLAKIYYESDPDAPGRTEAYRSKWEYHREKAKELLPENADAYLLRAVSTGIVPKALQYLDKALELDKKHYDSLRIRASLSYISKDYHRAVKDAAQMMAIEPNNPQGYSLCAIAERELGQYDSAIEDHDKAIAMLPDDAELYNQRWQTYMRMGRYEQALSDANMCVQLRPADRIHNYHVFYALVALGRYDEAQKKYDTITGSDRGRKHLLDLSASKYVSDSLAAGQSWYPRPREPKGTAFLAMHEAERMYLQLSKKAKRVVPDGFGATWCPDGSKLAYCCGTVGFSGIAILDLKSHKTDLLTTPGKDPEWSPDGEYIAYVRDRHVLPLSHLTASRQGFHRSGEEVWLIRADGTEEPSVLARGAWPSWSVDSRRVFFNSPGEFRSISIREDDESKLVTPTPSRYSAVSPDGKYCARTERNELSIVELSTGETDSSWHAPSVFWIPSMLRWSPDGQRLSLPYFTIWRCWAYDQMGLWIYDRTTGKASKVLSGSFGSCSWCPPDMSQMALQRCFSTLHNEIWVIDTASLGQGRTIEEHYQEMVDCCTRRIDADPSDMSNYLTRARYCALVKEEEKALADLEKCATMNPPRAGQMYFETAWRLVFDSGSQGDPAIAASLARMAVERDPNKWYFYMTLGMAQYYAGMHGEAIATLKQAENIYVAREQKPHRYSFLDRSDQLVASTTLYYHPNAACIAMTLHELGRHQEAEAALARLRRMFESAKNKELLRYLIEAEQLFAGKDGRISVAWDYIGNHRLDKALELLADSSVSESGDDPNLAASVKYLRRHLAREYTERGRARDREKEYSESAAAYESAITADPIHVLAHNNLAWLQATCPEAEFRNGAQAVKNATKVCELTNWKEGFYFDTLAAAYAEAGDFVSAVKWQKKAVDLLTEEERSRYKLEFEARMKLYQAGQPYHRQQIFAKQMVSQWTFDRVEDRSVLDSSHNDLHGKLMGDANIILDPQRGSVLSLDGDGDYVDCGNSSIFDITDEITVAAWIKVNAFEKRWETILAKGNTAWRLSRDGASDNIEYACTGLNLASGDKLSRVFGIRNVNDESWHHIAGVYDGEKMCLYVDSELDVSVRATGSININGNELLIGENGIYSGREWNGLIDDVRIYSYALSEEEIRDLYEETAQKSDVAEPVSKSHHESP